MDAQLVYTLTLQKRIPNLGVREVRDFNKLNGVLAVFAFQVLLEGLLLLDRPRGSSDFITVIEHRGGDGS